MTKRFYTAPDGAKYPLYEAISDTGFHVYKSDKRRAKLSDPNHCILALGIERHRDVLHCYIGSGKDAYVVYKARGKRPAFCFHYTVPASAAKVRDLFDTKGSPSTQIILLRSPTPGRTLAARRKLDKRRHEEIKNGSPVKHRGANSNKRITRLGVHHRPRAKITAAGSVSMEQQLTA